MKIALHQDARRGQRLRRARRHARRRSTLTRRADARASATAASASAPTRSWSSSAASTPGVDFRYRIFNGGSGDEVEQCGNGARCFVRFVRDKGLTDKRTIRVETHEPRCSSCACRTTAASRSTWARRSSTPARVPFDAAGPGAARDVGGFELWPLDVGDQTRRRRGAVDGQPARGAARGRRRHRAGRVARPAIERDPRFPRQGQRRLHAGASRATASACACTSAAPARRWPAAPAPARPSSPASGSACSTRGSRSRRAAGALTHRMGRRRRAGADDRPGDDRLRRRDRTVITRRALIHGHPGHHRARHRRTTWPTRPASSSAMPSCSRRCS